ncbi:MAG TPA: DUF3078 domain-containing protein [Flavipsychrobacter sp.]|nr:DUF3078 domain-containing protein [Flavipsychrobacter sp.]
MKKLLLFLSFYVFFMQANAQLAKTEDLKKSLAVENKDTVMWVKGSVFNIGINQGFLHNWAAGGEVASLTVNGQFSGFLNRVLHHHIWTNNLDMTYGLFYGYSNAFIPRKIDDRIDFTSKYGVQIGNSKSFYLSGLFNFKSQFTKGYDYSVPKWDSFSTSEFLSPAYFTGAIGIDYRKGNSISLFFSPIAARFTVADRYYTSMRPEGMFGIQYNETSRFEFGAYFTGRYQTEINKKILFKTRVDLYTNYLAKDKKDSLGVVVKKDNPGNIDILWDNFFSYKMSKHLSLTLAATFIYDNDIPYQSTYTDQTTDNELKKDEPGEGLGWWQVKQVLAVGFEYRF